MSAKFVLLSSESFTSYVLYDRFLRDHADQLAAIFEIPYLEFSTEKKRDRSVRILKRSSFTYFAFKVLTVAVYRPFARLFRRDLESFCQDRKIPYFDCVGGMNDEILQKIASFKPDVIFNASALILTQSLLDIPKVGCMSFHGARLPEFRGAANYFWVLAEGQKETQATLHFVEKGLDTGPIIAYGKKVAITERMSVFDVYLAVLKTGFELLSKGLAHVDAFVEKGVDVPTTEQDTTKATMRSLPQASDVERLKARGFRVFSIADAWRMIHMIWKGV